jgi:imidazole glycerol-phosphate synthase subunit HisH
LITPKVAIIDTGGANLSSITNVMSKLSCEYHITTDPDLISKCTHVILPGVGSAKPIMERLNAHTLIPMIRELKKPTIGICLGMQILFNSSKEDNIDCIGIIDGTIEPLTADLQTRVPHMGWNQIDTKDDPIYNNIQGSFFAYFAHSFHAKVNNYTIGTTYHGVSFSSVVKYKNFYGFQFHPEKSGEIGQTLLNNFLQIKL